MQFYDGHFENNRKKKLIICLKIPLATKKVSCKLLMYWVTVIEIKLFGEETKWRQAQLLTPCIGIFHKTKKMLIKDR